MTMGRAGTVEVDVKGNFDSFKNELNKTGSNAGATAGTNAGKSFAGGFGKQVATLGGAYLGASFAKGVIDQASDLAEATNVTGLAFGSARGQVDAFAKGANDALGMTESSFRQLSAQVGNIFVGAGIASADASKLTLDLVTRAADIGSAWNATTEEVTQGINSALIGSFEPLRRFGVIIDQAAVKQQALTMGLVAEGEELDSATEKLAIQALVMEQTANVAGDFANTSDGVANSSKILKAQWGDMQAQLGAGLLPVLKTVLGVLRALGPDGLKLVVVIGAGLVAFVKLTQGVQALSGAMNLLSASPVVLGLLAIVAAGVLVYKNWDTIKAAAVVTWETITGIVDVAADGILGAVSSVADFIVGIPSRITGAFATLAGIITAPFAAAFATIKTLWNATLGGFGFTTPSWLPLLGGKSFTIPSMATGGVAASPMVAMIGDAGAGNPEVVSPVDLMRSTMLDALADSASSAAGVNLHMHVSAEVRDPAFFERQATEMVRVVNRELDRQRRAAGRERTGLTR